MRDMRGSFANDLSLAPSASGTISALGATESKTRVGGYNFFSKAVTSFLSSSWSPGVSSSEVNPSSVDGNGEARQPLYAGLLDIGEAVRSIDVKIEATRSACEALSHLLSPNSAATALERARGLLFEAAASGSGSGGDRME